MVNLNMVKIEDVKMVLMQFDQHDADGSGLLDQRDLDAVLGKAGKVLNAAAGAPAGGPLHHLQRGREPSVLSVTTSAGGDFASSLQAAMHTGGFACIPALIKLYFFIAFGLVWLLVDAMIAMCVVAIVASISPERETAQAVHRMHAANFMGAISLASSFWTAIWACLYAHLDSDNMPGTQFSRDFFFFFQGVHQEAIRNRRTVKMMSTWSMSFVALAVMSLLQMYLTAVFGYRCAIALARERERERSGSPVGRCSTSEISMADLITTKRAADSPAPAPLATQNLARIVSHKPDVQQWAPAAST